MIDDIVISIFILDLHEFLLIQYHYFTFDNAIHIHSYHSYHWKYEIR